MPNDRLMCPGQPQLDELAASIKILAEKIEVLCNFADTAISWNRQIIKWLLTVVCIIALGRSALDLGRSVVSGTLPNANSQTLSGDD